MERVLVIGLGEVGLPLYQVLKESGKFDVYGLDVDFKKMTGLDQPWVFKGKFDVMHICFPYNDKFVDTVVEYVRKYWPKILIINSTVVPNTSKEICKILFLKDDVYVMVAHSPVRGMHKYMKKDLLRYVKYVGGVSKLHGQIAEEHFKKAGFKTKLLNNAIDTELAKLFNTTYRAVMITAFQEMHRIAIRQKADFVGIVDFIHDTNKIRGDKPILFPDVIGGHCLIQNTKMLLSIYRSKLYQYILESNEQRKREVKNSVIRKAIDKVRDTFYDRSKD